MKPLYNFAFQLGAGISFNTDFLIKRGGRYFILNEVLLKIPQRDFYYAGKYLGKVKKGKFFPSFNLLRMLAQGKANKIVLAKKAAWLFICGRDVFRKGILAVQGSHKKGDHTLVLNEFGDCLGFGKLSRNLNDEIAKNEVALRNLLDVGDFLRREI